MTAPPDAPAMRVHLVLLAAACVSCATSRPATKTAAPDECPDVTCAQEPVPAKSAGPATVRIFEVSDIVKPAGDAAAADDLASQWRADVTFLLGERGVDIEAQGTSLVVKASPHVMARLANHLARKRAGVSPNWL